MEREGKQENLLGCILGTICIAEDPEPMTATVLSLYEYESSHRAECARCPRNDLIPVMSGHFQLLNVREYILSKSHSCYSLQEPASVDHHLRCVDENRV